MIPLTPTTGADLVGNLDVATEMDRAIEGVKHASKYVLSCFCQVGAGASHACPMASKATTREPGVPKEASPAGGVCSQGYPPLAMREASAHGSRYDRRRDLNSPVGVAGTIPVRNSAGTHANATTIQLEPSQNSDAVGL